MKNGYALYYKPDDSNELEFLIEKNGEVVPVEVKAGNTATKYRKSVQKNAKKYCVQSGDNIYPEDGRFSIADSNVTYWLQIKAFAQANIRNPILPIRRLRFNGQPYKNKSKPGLIEQQVKIDFYIFLSIILYVP